MSLEVGNFMFTIPLISLAVILLFVFVVAIAVSQMYNKLVLLKNRCQNGFAQIEVQLKRRYDLIPNLVECVKGYMEHERETLENVMAARNQAASGLVQAAKDPSNAAAMKAFIGSETALAGALGRLSFVMEAYPDLKANDTVAQLTEELTHTENRVAFARQSYNDLVMSFNTYRQSFPAIVFVGALGFVHDLQLLEMADREAIQSAPTVALTS
jgi:LemA protein